MRPSRRAPLTRPSLYSIILAITIGIGVIAVAHTARPMWHHFNREYAMYHAYTPAERRDAASAVGGFGPLFGDPSAYIVPGDRMYFLVPNERFGDQVTIRQQLSRLGRYYLLPAVEVKSPADATVIVSYRADPNSLGKRYIEQIPLDGGLVVSRIRLP